MRYILKESIEPVGYEGLPYGYFERKIRKTSFVDKELFALLLMCSGKKDIDEDSLTDRQKKFFHKMKEKEMIREAKEEEKRDLFKVYKMYPTRYRADAEWSVTGRCNYRCKHCFMSAPECTYGHLPLEKCLEIARQLGECGIRNVSLTGGEVFMRKDIMQIVDCLLENDVVPVSILTNGALVTEEILDALAERKLRPHFQLSYDGVGWHDWLRGVDGAEESLLKVFAMLKERKMTFGCAMTLHKRNAHTIKETAQKIAECGGIGLKINVAAPEGEWKQQQENALTMEEGFQAYLDYLPSYIEDGMPIDLTLDGAFMYSQGKAYAVFDKGEEGYKTSRCVCGTMRVTPYIAPEGEIYPCVTMISEDGANIFPNLFKTPLKEILMDSHYQRCSTCTIEELIQHNEVCASCEYLKRCRGGCRACGYACDRSDYYHQDESACAYFKNGWAEKFKVYIDQINAKKGNGEIREEDRLDC